MRKVAGGEVASLLYRSTGWSQVSPSRPFVAPALAVALGCACGGAETPPVKTAVVASRASSSPAQPPPPPPEPAGLVEVRAPSAECQIAGSVDDYPVQLAASSGGPPLGLFYRGSITVSIGQHDTFVQVRAPWWTVRGFVRERARVPWHVLPTQWVSFGGVLFAGAGGLEVTDVHGGKVVLAAPKSPGFTLAETARTTAVPCDDVSFDGARGGVLRDEAPAPFTPAAPQQAMTLELKKPVAVSAEVNGGAVGSFDATDRAPGVVVLERRGARARVRWEHVVGWIDSGHLVKTTPEDRKRWARDKDMSFGMIGLITSGAGSAADLNGGRTEPPWATVGWDSRAAAFVCATDLRVVAETAGGQGAPARFVVGSIPAGQSVFVTEPGPELTQVMLPYGWAIHVDLAARMSVPSRDLAVLCAPAKNSRPIAPTPTFSDVPPTDAIDKLPSPIDLVSAAPGARIAQPR
jgi:hypothetical protein